MDEAIKTLAAWLQESKKAVFFGGAGVSTASGIPDFRSTDGLYNQQYAWPPETILSHTFFEEKPEEFYRFYQDKMLCLEAQPNTCHLRLAELEQEGHLRSVVTQNIDGLHQAAGSRRVWELHGSVLRNYCQKCGKSHDVFYMKEAAGVPRCQVCGGMLKPDVVLYEEGLDTDVITGAVNDISQADMLIIGGTSLVVYPAAGLIDYFRGDALAVINKAPTPRDSQADLLIQGSIGEALSKL